MTTQRRRTSLLATLLALALLAVACGSSDTSDDAAPSPTATSSPASDSPSPDAPISGQENSAASVDSSRFGPAPEVVDTELSDEVRTALSIGLQDLNLGVDFAMMEVLGASGDVRIAWVLSDVARFLNSEAASQAARDLTGLQDVSWNNLTNHLIGWDIPAPPDYPQWKRIIFDQVDDRWDFVFDDPDANIDYRYLSWGGVFIDDRQLGDVGRCPRGCIPALDDPGVTVASAGDWYPDDAIVFGVEINGEARAYPKNIMEIHEMVNDTLGGRRIGMPYCTLCLSAQVYFTDQLPEGVTSPVLRTSGLLTRSNKVMYDLVTRSVFDTFTGEALSGPLREQALVLEQATVITTTWGQWKAEHPDTTIVAEDGGIGRTYRLDPLDGRDDNGPIFPIGSTDSRLAVQERVIGITTPDGEHVAFPVGAARLALEAGQRVILDNIELFDNAGGIRAEIDGEDHPSHESFWFAWSQFHPDTRLWTAPS